MSDFADYVNMVTEEAKRREVDKRTIYLAGAYSAWVEGLSAYEYIEWVIQYGGDYSGDKPKSWSD